MPLSPVSVGGEGLTLRDMNGNVLTAYTGQDDPDTPLSPVDPTTPSGAQPVGASGYDLVLSEEFNAPMQVVDAETGHVKFRNGGHPWATWYPSWPRFTSQDPGGNHTNTNQLAYYATSKVSTAGGTLRLACDQQATVAGLPYTAGMITTKDMFEPEYGRFEARLRIVGARSSRHWPAWWMSASTFNQWPPEIDVWEVFGTASEYLTNVYRPSGGGSTIEHETFDDFAVYHVYGVEWAPSGVTFYRDGVATFSTATVSGPQYLILNNGVEGPTASGAMPVLEVDYVRAWSLP